MNVLSLFDGMSCAYLALKKAGFHVNQYYASEVDKHAIKESKANIPNIQHIGDICNWKRWSINWSSIDFVIGGSPCQGFSFAGKQKGFKDNRSFLFVAYIDVLRHVQKFNPNVSFLLENTRMKKESMDVISSIIGVQPVFIDSSLVSAQMRKRLYWCNWNVQQPKDRGVMLSDIIESGYVDWEKSYCLTATYVKGTNLQRYKEYGQRQIVFCGAMRGRYLNKKNKLTKQRIEVKFDNKTNALTSVQKDNLLVFNPKNKHCDIDKVDFRKLTIKECCRLQGVPEDYFKVSSNTQAYKMLGNGFQVDTVAHIFSALKCGK